MNEGEYMSEYVHEWVCERGVCRHELPQHVSEIVFEWVCAEHMLVKVNEYGESQEWKRVNERESMEKILKRYKIEAYAIRTDWLTCLYNVKNDAG